MIDHKTVTKWLIDFSEDGKSVQIEIDYNGSIADIVFNGSLEEMVKHVKNVIKIDKVSILTRRQIQSRLIIQLTNKYGLDLESWS